MLDVRAGVFSATSASVLPHGLGPLCVSRQEVPIRHARRKTLGDSSGMDTMKRPEAESGASRSRFLLYVRRWILKPTLMVKQLWLLLLLSFMLVLATFLTAPPCSMSVRTSASLFTTSSHSLAMKQNKNTNGAYWTHLITELSPCTLSLEAYLCLVLNTNLRSTLQVLLRSLPVDIDAQVRVLPDLETDIFLGVEEVVHHLVVDLEIAHSHEALRGVRRQPLGRTKQPK